MSKAASLYERPLRESVRGDVARLVRGTASYRGPLSPVRVAAAFVSNRGLQALLLYRLSHALWRRGVPGLPMLLSRVAQIVFAVDIDYKAQLGPGISLVHCFGIVIGGNARLEGDSSLFHGVTLGDRGSEWVGSSRPDGHPTLERGLIVGAGAKILGPIRVGHHSVIGANSVVMDDVPPCSVVAGIPGRVVSRNKSAVCHECQEKEQDAA